MTEKLCLKWNDFQKNTNTAFGSLRNDNNFSDITLVCEDGEQVEAHKVILAASSPFFHTMLRRNKHPHPLIYMRGVKSADLVAIVDFLYYGEANVYQENIDAFLAVAEDLKLKGLTGNDRINQLEKNHEEDISENKLVRSELETDPHQFGKQAVATETVQAVTNYPVSNVSITDIKDLDEHVVSMMVKSENHIPNTQRKADMCTVCGKEGYQMQIKDHIEANHMEGVSIPCNYCDKTFRSRNALRLHNRDHK